MAEYKNRGEKKRIDPLFIAVLAMLTFVPIINACSTFPATRTKVNTANIDVQNIDSDWEDEEDELSSLSQSTTLSFKANKNAPTSDRLEAIENQLTQMRNDFNAIYPSIRRLVAIEQDMQELISELQDLTAQPAPVAAPSPRPGLSQSLTKEEAIAQAAELRRQAEARAAGQSSPTTNLTQPPNINTPAPVPAPAPIVNAAPTPATGAINATVNSIRIGVHADIVRVVLDYAPGSQIKFDKLQNGQNFELYLENTAFNARKSWQSEFVPMVDSYSVAPNGSDVSINFVLEAGTSLKSAFVIPPSPSNAKPRLVVDFMEN